MWQLSRKDAAQVTPENKRAMVNTLYDDLPTASGVTPALVCMQRLATSLALVYEGQKDRLELPLPGLPLALAANPPGG